MAKRRSTNTKSERIDPELLRKLARVDWLRTLQRVSVFLRDLRGDDPRDIQDDHTAELTRSQKLREAASRMYDSLDPRRKPT